jgi:hypothetical protein
MNSNNFWLSGTGVIPTGLPQDSFVGDFTVIPESTQASATIKQFCLIEKQNEYKGINEKFYQVTFKLLDGDYKSREVTLKIKCFDGKPEQIQRNLNMLKLILQLCDFQPTHTNAPTDQDLMATIGKSVHVKIGEYSIPRNDGTCMEGNFVREVHKIGSIETETGVKKVTQQPVNSGMDSALTRNPSAPLSDDGFPF